MQRTKAALVHTGQIALVVGCCGLSALVAARLASTSLELIYSSWGGPRVAWHKGELLRDGRFWGN